MRFYAFGLNHETAPVAVREVFALDEGQQQQFYESFQRITAAEVLLLSTCNRTEVYLFGAEADVAIAKAALSAIVRETWPEAYAFLLQDEPAVLHVLEVTGGLRSMVLGDAQILSQVKDAYRLTVDAGCAGTTMHRLMHTAFRAAKRVVTETALMSGAASVSSAAVSLAQGHFRQHDEAGMVGRRALVVGAGCMGQLVLAILKGQRLASVAVTNRSPQRAEKVAASVGAEVVPWARRYEAAAQADVVIVATQAPEPVLRASAMHVRAPEASPTLVVDIAVPRNVEPAVDALPSYTVLDLDALNASLERVGQQRSADVPAARAICDELLVEFVSWFFHQQALQPVIHAIRDTFESIRVQELERHAHRFSDQDRAELDRLTRSIVQKVLAVPVVRLKSVEPESVDFVHGIRLLHALFARPSCEDASAHPEPGAAPSVYPLARAAAALRQSAPECPFEIDDAAASARSRNEALLDAADPSAPRDA